MVPEKRDIIRAPGRDRDVEATVGAEILDGHRDGRISDRELHRRLRQTSSVTGEHEEARLQVEGDDELIPAIAVEVAGGDGRRASLDFDLGQGLQVAAPVAQIDPKRLRDAPRHQVEMAVAVEVARRQLRGRDRHHEILPVKGILSPVQEQRDRCFTAAQRADISHAEIVEPIAVEVSGQQGSGLGAEKHASTETQVERCDLALVGDAVRVTVDAASAGDVRRIGRPVAVAVGLLREGFSRKERGAQNEHNEKRVRTAIRDHVNPPSLDPHPMDGPADSSSQSEPSRGCRQAESPTDSPSSRHDHESRA